MKLNILHLSDLHFSDKYAHELEQIKNNLIENEQKRKIPIDCLIFSGDLVQQPSEKAFKNAYDKFILPIIEELNIDKNNIIFTAGNHDVNLEKREDFLFEGVKKKIIIDQDQTSKNKLRKNEIPLYEHDDFVNFIDSLNINTIVENNRLYNIQTLNINKMKVGFVSLNSSLFTEGSQNDFNNLWISPEILLDAAKKIKDCSIKILNLHHSYHWFKNYKEVEKNILDTFNIVFFGHDHEHDGKYVMDMQNRDILNLYATSMFHSTNDSNGYCMYTYEFNKQTFELHKSVYSKQDLCFENIEKQEIYDIDLTRKASNALRNELICSSLLPNVKTKVNQYLAINLTSEEHTQDIEDIYIEQQIERETDIIKKEDKKEDLWKIKNIITSDENILVIGKEESGKTTLLNMINITSLQCYTNKIPIYIYSGKLKNEKSRRVLDSYIGDYLERFYEKNNFNCKKMIDDKRFIFLIDDIQYLEEELISSILETGSKIIATTTENPKRAIINALNIVHNHTIFSDFIKLKLKSLKKEECHTLTNNILPQANTELAKTVYKTIINLHLPSNPFIATLLTWMHMEKMEIKENEPAIIEVFLDYLLEKSEMSKVFKGKFDFYQKMDLLSEIAYLFYQKQSFSINENEVLKIIIDYVDKYGHAVKPAELLNYFYKRKVFIGDDNTVMFSYRVFYYFFIAKYMERNQEFTTEIMSNKTTIINMISELKYYAAIKRDDIPFITVIIEYMEENNFQTTISKHTDLENMILPTEKNHLLDYHDEDDDEHTEEINNEENEIKEKIQKRITEVRDTRTEKYNEEKNNESIDLENNKKLELFLLNIVLSQFIKQLDKVEVGTKQDLLNDAIKRYAQFMIFWEKKFNNKKLMKRFLHSVMDESNPVVKDLFEMLEDEKMYNRISQNAIKKVMFQISETVVDSLSTPKLTKVYNANIEVENNIYLFYFYLLIKAEVDENNLIETISKFIKYNKDINLFEVLRQKLLYDLVDKNYSSKTKKEIKKIVIEILSIQNGKKLSGASKARLIKKYKDQIEEEIKTLKLLV